MNYPVFLAKLKRRANIRAELYDLTRRYAVFMHIIRKRGEQLHADIDIPPGVVFMRNDHLILTVDDVRMPTQNAHQPVLVADLLDLLSELCTHGVFAHGALHLLVLSLSCGDGDHLERTVKIAAVFVFFLQLIHLAGAAAADAVNGLPAGKSRKFLFHKQFP